MASSVAARLPDWWRNAFRKQETPILAVTSFFTGLLGFALVNTWMRRLSAPSAVRKQDAASTDPGLLKKGTTYERYETSSGHVYPRIRTFYSAHPQKKKLPEDIPLLVFMHGLGGSAAQFAPLLTSLVNTAPCLAIDLPGCGLSDFEPSAVEAYTTVSFAELLYCAIERFRNKKVNQRVVLIGHSMGCSISALLSSSSSPLAGLDLSYVVGLCAICPRSTTMSEHDLLSIQRLSYVPSPLFDLIRLADRRGGVDSASVMRVVGKDADPETKKLQLRFNQQSKSSVFQKVLLGLHEQESRLAAKGEESLLGQRVWSGLKVPLFLVAAESDKLAPPKEAEQIASWLNLDRRGTGKISAQADTAQSHTDQSNGPTPLVPAASGDTELASEQLSGLGVSPDIQSNSSPDPVIKEENSSTKHSSILKISVFPAPASHGLLYATADVRVLSGLIENFLAKHVDQRLSPGWQLQHLTTSGKWDVKNLKKWQAIEPCSEPIGGIFRAMKTMREVDDVHQPKEFVKHYSYQVIPDGVAMVIDISHEAPVYNKSGLEEGGVEYYKFPTVSKLPPTADEVEHFISLIDELRRSPKLQPKDDGAAQPLIGIHCHYGFNRTGFFIVCYLVERLGYRLQDAVEEFATKRTPGIKHEYFVNELFVRYAVKLERRGTLIG